MSNTVTIYSAVNDFGTRYHVLTDEQRENGTIYDGAEIACGVNGCDAIVNDIRPYIVPDGMTTNTSDDYSQGFPGDFFAADGSVWQLYDGAHGPVLISRDAHTTIALKRA